MKKTGKQRWKQWIACILALTLFVQSIIPETVLADSKTEQVISEVEGNLEAAQEEMEDAVSLPTKAGDWWYATQKDYIRWGEFHNAVQDHIVDKYEEMKKELLETYTRGQKKGKPKK